jgi:hypothetical protein
MPERAALVTALIVERPTCEDCILSKTGLARPDFDAAMRAVRAALRIHDQVDRCRACGALAPVLSLDRPQ